MVANSFALICLPFSSRFRFASFADSFLRHFLGRRLVFALIFALSALAGAFTGVFIPGFHFNTVGKLPVSLLRRLPINFVPTSLLLGRSLAFRLLSTRAFPFTSILLGLTVPRRVSRTRRGVSSVLASFSTEFSRRARLFLTFLIVPQS